jgi:hypothetical protein
MGNTAQKRALRNVSRTIPGEPPKKGGILAALRRSPLVGADLNLARSRETDRQVAPVTRNPVDTNIGYV